MSKVSLKKRVGLILRTFATKKEDIPGRVGLIVKLIEAAQQMKIDDEQVFGRIDVLVWADKRFPDADCGETEMILREYEVSNRARFGTIMPIIVSTVEHGDLFCGVLNRGIAHQLRDCDYSLIVSSEALNYFNTETVVALLDAVDQGAKAAGVAINELTESVLEGRLTNTMCLWDNVALMSVGGFDLRAAKPTDDKVGYYVKGMDSQGNKVYHAIAGVEECIPLARLVDAYGRCIAPILPRGQGVKRYQVPDPQTQPELYARHIEKMGTKLLRQFLLLGMAGYDKSYLRVGVMEAYRQQ